MDLADSFARPSAGNSMAARIAMMAMTTSNSIKVNADGDGFDAGKLERRSPTRRESERGNQSVGSGDRRSIPRQKCMRVEFTG